MARNINLEEPTFYRPAPNPLVFSILHLINRAVILRRVKLVVDEASINRWRSLPRDAGILIALKRAYGRDLSCAYELARRIGITFLFMADIQIEEKGLGARITRDLLKAVGTFPVQVGGKSNVSAARFVLETLDEGKWQIALYPESDLYYTNDVVLPMKQGIAFFSLEGARQRQAAGKPPGVYILPVAMRSVFSQDMSAILLLKLQDLEDEVLGSRQKGEMLPRINKLLEKILEYAESRFGIKTQGGTCDERLVCLGRCLVERLEEDEFGRRSLGLHISRATYLSKLLGRTSEKGQAAFFARYCLAFLPGYLLECSQERLLETLTKIEILAKGRDFPTLYTPQREPILMHVRVQEPIQANRYLQSYLEPSGKQRAMNRLMEDLQASFESSLTSLRREAARKGC